MIYALFFYFFPYSCKICFNHFSCGLGGLNFRIGEPKNWISVSSRGFRLRFEIAKLIFKLLILLLKLLILYKSSIQLNHVAVLAGSDMPDQSFFILKFISLSTQVAAKVLLIDVNMIDLTQDGLKHIASMSK